MSLQYLGINLATGYRGTPEQSTTMRQIIDAAGRLSATQQTLMVLVVVEEMPDV
jgi:TPP-dependent indolepyruvate ferredoxin oxidoreductase alpha subunit